MKTTRPANDTTIAITLRGDVVRATIEPVSGVVGFTAIIHAPGKVAHGAKQDTVMRAAGKRDAVKLYKWASVHVERLAHMSAAEFRDEMEIFGIRLA